MSSSLTQAYIIVPTSLQTADTWTEIEETHRRKGTYRERKTERERVRMGRMTSFDEFLQVHGVLLASSGLPPSLHRQLFHKLTNDTLDAGNFFSIEEHEEEEEEAEDVAAVAARGPKQRRLLLSSSAHPILPRHSQVFLIDHAWSFRLPDARSQVCSSFLGCNYFHKPTRICKLGGNYPSFVHRYAINNYGNVEEENEEENDSKGECCICI